MPEDINQEFPTKNSYRAARVEPYIDIDGQIKQALCYGDEAEQLNTWFNLDEVLKVYSKWKMTTPSNFFNNRKFTRTARRDWQENKKKDYNPSRGRGGWTRGGRGGWRGSYNSYNNNNSYNPYSSGIGRGKYDSDRRDREREQQDWEDFQAQRNREREGYYTKEYEYEEKKRIYEDKKRARSPSRGDRPGREDGDYQRYYRRNQSPDRREQAPERRSRRDYSNDRRRERSKWDYSPEGGRRYPDNEK